MRAHTVHAAVSVHAVLAGLVLLALLSGRAQAQVQPIGPFVGAFSDGFEGHAPQQVPECVETGVFGGRAQLCAAFGSSVTISGGFPGSVQPHAGAQLFHTDVLANIVFSEPARRFGLWLASPWVGGGTAYLYDPAGILISAEPLNLAPCGPAGCPWSWNGWEVGGAGIGSIQFDTPTATGGHFEMDDLEVGFVCDGTLHTYCTGKVNSLGCVPAIAATGQPSASHASGFAVSASNVRNQKSGILLYGVSGRAALPFQGGFLCVAPQVRRTPGTSSGGSPLPAHDCTGVWSLDMNAFAAGALGGSPLPALSQPGTTVQCQWWGRDPGFAPPNNTALSDGLEYAVCP